MVSSVAETNGHGRALPGVRFIPLSYNPESSDASAHALILALRPEWASPDLPPSSTIDLVRFTDGITNTLLKAAPRRPGLSSDEANREAILLRAYGHGTDVLIDRHRETQNHELLMRHGLAPELLARFENGMLYRFTQGTVTQPEDMRRPDISRAIARRLAEWHVKVPCMTAASSVNGYANGSTHNGDPKTEAVDNVAPGKPAPNIWTVMQKWIFALPSQTEAERQRQAQLQHELEELVATLSPRPGLGSNGLVFAHTDLLSGNVIVLPQPSPSSSDTAALKITEPSVSFIDYEYAVPSPAAFDIANHFAEWGGFDCNVNVLPTKSQRRVFVEEYIHAYASFSTGSKHATPQNGAATPTSNGHATGPANGCTTKPGTAGPVPAFDEAAETENLLREIDIFRGVPGFYWGIWALIQAQISHIEFDYASYAETRLAEYWAWKAEDDGSRPREGADMPARERRWAQEA